MAVFDGVFSVLPTPFAPSGDIDSDSLKRLVDVFIADGVNGFTALGVTSEVARLTDAERDAVLDTVVTHVNGRVPIVAGTTAEGLRTCIEYTRRAKATGVSAVMISLRRRTRTSIGPHGPRGRLQRLLLRSVAGVAGRDHRPDRARGVLAQTVANGRSCRPLDRDFGPPARPSLGASSVYSTP